MKRFTMVVFLCLAFAWPGLGQGRAVLTSPVLNAGPDTISFVTRFSDFVEGRDYRIGVGTTDGPLAGANFELSRDGAVISKELFSFRQGSASAYFEVDEIQVQGYFFPASELPPANVEITLRVSLPRSEADRAQRIFVVVTKQFGPDTWYIMDGAEMNSSHW